MKESKMVNYNSEGVVFPNPVNLLGPPWDSNFWRTRSSAWKRDVVTTAVKMLLSVNFDKYYANARRQKHQNANVGGLLLASTVGRSVRS